MTRIQTVRNDPQSTRTCLGHRTGYRFGALASLLALAAFAGPPAPKKPTVAILYFDYDKTDELEVLKKGLAQMLITDLGAHPNVILVERARIQAVFDELKLGESKKVDPATAVKVGKVLSAKYVLIGGYFAFAGQLQINTRLVNTETSGIIPGPGVRGKPDAFFELEGELSQKLSSLLTTEIPAGAAGSKETAAPPRRPGKSNVKVALGYSRALDAIDKKDKATAKTELEAVVKEQPDFVLASLDLAELVK